MQKYFLEFILDIRKDASPQAVKNSIIEFGEDVEISRVPEPEGAEGKYFKIRLSTEDPAIIFDTCAQFGKLKSIKIE